MPSIKFNGPPHESLVPDAFAKKPLVSAHAVVFLDILELKSRELYCKMYHDFTRLVVDPDVVSSIPAQSHTFVEIDNDIFSTVILLLPLI